MHWIQAETGEYISLARVVLFRATNEDAVILLDNGDLIILKSGFECKEHAQEWINNFLMPKENSNG